MLDRKVFAGAAHAGHHFIRDEQDAVRATDVGDALEIAGRRRNRTQRRSTHGLKDKCGGRTLRLSDGTLQFRGILLPAVVARVGAVEFAAIAIRNSNVREFLHHGEINLAPFFVAGNGKGAQRRAVIALLTTEDFVALGLSDLDLVLPR